MDSNMFIVTALIQLLVVVEILLYCKIQGDKAQIELLMCSLARYVMTNRNVRVVDNESNMLCSLLVICSTPPLL